MEHNNQDLVIRLEILHYICLLRTADQCQSSGEPCGNTEHISFYSLNTFNLYIGSKLLFSDSVFCFLHQEVGYYFFSSYVKKKNHLKQNSTIFLLFCSIKATDTSILLLPESTWRFYKAQFVVVPKCYRRICGDGTAFTAVMQLLHSKHFYYLGKNKLLPLIKHSESTIFIESLIVRVHSNSFRYPTSQCMEINILKCKHSKEIRIDNPSVSI